MASRSTAEDAADRDGEALRIAPDAVVLIIAGVGFSEWPVSLAASRPGCDVEGYGSDVNPSAGSST
jgi:hypothetical protein